MAGGDKTIWVIANWKSNKNIAESLDWISKVGLNIPKNDSLKVVVCPTFSVLSEVKKAITVGNFPILLGSQDLSPYGLGAYTGEDPTVILKDLVEFSIIGHSERRKNFNETDEIIDKKLQQAIENKIIPVLCVQDSDTPIPRNSSLVAYEPIWAISTGLNNTPGVGRADNPEDANKVAKDIKRKHGNDLQILYGGSVNSQNVAGFLNEQNINGVLVGNASLDAEEFIKICSITSERL